LKIRKKIELSKFIFSVILKLRHFGKVYIVPEVRKIMKYEKIKSNLKAIGNKVEDLELIIGGASISLGTIGWVFDNKPLFYSGVVGAVAVSCYELFDGIRTHIKENF